MKEGKYTYEDWVAFLDDKMVAQGMVDQVEGAKKLWSRLSEAFGERLTLPQTGPTMIGSIDMVWDTGRYFISVESCLGGEYCWMYKDRDTGSFKSRYNVYLDACVSDITFVLDLVLPKVR